MHRDSIITLFTEIHVLQRLKTASVRMQEHTSQRLAAVRLTTFRLELDELLGHFVVAALRQNAQDGPACLVELDASPERTPARTRALLSNLAQLHDGDADEAVLASEVVVFGTDVELVRPRVILIANNAATTKSITLLVVTFR